MKTVCHRCYPLTGAQGLYADEPCSMHDGSMMRETVVTDSTRVKLLEDSTGLVTWSGTLGEFFASNDYDSQDSSDIRRDLISDGTYAIAGGAGPLFFLVLEGGPK